MARLVHKILIYVVVVTALCFLVKFVYLGIKFKYWLVYLGQLILNYLKLWISTRRKRYTDGHNIYETFGQGGGNWKIDGERKNVAYELAYSKYNPESFWDLNSSEE